MWLVPELTADAASALTELITPGRDDDQIFATQRFDGEPVSFDKPGRYPVLVAAPWDAVLTDWITSSEVVDVAQVCRDALALGFSPQQPSGYYADLWWLDVAAPCRFEPPDTLQHGIAALGMLDGLVNAHALALKLEPKHTGSVVLGWAERALVQWTFNDGEALTLELLAAEQHAMLTFSSARLKRPSELLQTLQHLAGGPDTRLESRPAFFMGTTQVYAS